MAKVEGSKGTFEVAMEEMEMVWQSGEGSRGWGEGKGCVEEVEVAGLSEVVKVGDEDRRGIPRRTPGA